MSPDEQIFVIGVSAFILIFLLIMIAVYWINSKDEHRNDLIKTLRQFFNNISSPLTRAVLIALAAITFLIIIEAIWWSSQTGRYEFIDAGYNETAGDYLILDTSTGILHRCNYFIEIQRSEQCNAAFKD